MPKRNMPKRNISEIRVGAIEGKIRPKSGPTVSTQQSNPVFSKRSAGFHKPAIVVRGKDIRSLTSAESKRVRLIGKSLGADVALGKKGALNSLLYLRKHAQEIKRRPPTIR